MTAEAKSDHNCIEGMKCPACGQCEEFRIQALVVTAVTPGGVQDIVSEFEWDEDSTCLCPKCDHTSTVLAFHAKEAANG